MIVERKNDNVGCRNNGLEVEPGEAKVISSITLFAKDKDTPSTEIMYIFERVPTQGTLQLKVSAMMEHFKHVLPMFGSM